MNLSEKLTINENFTVRDLGDEVVLLSQEGDVLHSLEETGLWIWNKLQSGLHGEAILSRLVEEYDIDTETAAKDLGEFLQSLIDKNILLK